MTILTDSLHYSPNSKTFSAEISDLVAIHLAIAIIPKKLNISNHKTGVSKEFEMVSVDKDGSGEDTYGWNYKNQETGVKFLLIND